MPFIYKFQTQYTAVIPPNTRYWLGTLLYVTKVQKMHGVDKHKIENNDFLQAGREELVK